MMETAVDWGLKMILFLVLFTKKLLGTNIDPGARQSVGPKPPTRIGPFPHNKPSELDKAMKK
jgi:hypothetical protein